MTSGCTWEGGKQSALLGMGEGSGKSVRSVAKSSPLPHMHATCAAFPPLIMPYACVAPAHPVPTLPRTSSLGSQCDLPRCRDTLPLVNTISP